MAAGLVGLVCLLGGNAALAQMEPSPTPSLGDGVLFGTVFESAPAGSVGTPIPEAHLVVFLDVESFAPMPPLAATWTNNLGQYRFENLPTGPDFPLRVVLEKRGYDRLVVNDLIIPPDSAHLQQDFFLTPGGTEPTPTPTTNTLVRITGRVYGATSSTDRVPLAEAHVEVRAGEADITIYPPPPPVAETFSDPEGFYELFVPADLILPSRIIAVKMGYDPQVRRIEALPSAGLVIDFTLTPHTEPSPTATPPPLDGFLHGVVYEISPSTTDDSNTTPAGIPLPEAVVTVWPATGAGTDPSLLPLGRAVTDDQGRYRIDHLPAGIPLVARATKLEYTVDARHIDGLTADGLEMDFFIAHRILPTPTPTPTEPPPGETGLCGLVVEHSILTVVLPIQGARVELYQGWDSTQPPGSSVAPVAVTETDENGRFCFVPLEAGWYLVKASADGFLPEFRTLAIRDGYTLEIVLALHPVTPTATPPPPPGSGTIFGHVMTAVPEGSLMPTMLIPGAEVLAFLLPLPEGDADALGADETPWVPPTGRAITDDQGAYVIPGLPPGPYLVIARKEGFYPQRHDAQVLSDQGTEVNFALERRLEPSPTATPPPPPPDAGSIHGMVFNALALSPLPQPIAEALVVVFPADQAQEGGMMDWQPLPILGRAVTNDRGLYRIEGLPPIPVVVRAYKEGYQPGRVLADVQPVTDTLVNIGLVPLNTTPTPTPPPPTDDAQVFGQVLGVTGDGSPHPVEGATVCLFAPDGLQMPGHEPAPVACAETDARGRYYLVVAPGDYVAVASALGYHREMRTIRLQPGPNDPVDFLLLPAVEPTPPPTDPVGRVEGRVVQWQDPRLDQTDSLPLPIPDALVTLYDATRDWSQFEEPVARTRTDDQGHFVFERVPAGLYIGVAQKRGFERDAKPVPVAPGETTRVEFILKAVEPEPTPPPPADLGGLAGRVVAAATDETTTHPVAGALVTAFRINRDDTADAAVRPAGMAVTDAEGLWRIGGLYPGEYLVVAKARGYEPDRADAVVRAGEVTRVHLVLVASIPPDPTLPGSIVGRVMKPSPMAMNHDGPPLAESLALEPVEGSTVTTYLVRVDQADPELLEPSGIAVTDAEGRFEIAPLSPGVHLVIARAEGLLPAIQLARVEPDRVTRVLLILLDASFDGMGPWPPIEVVDGSGPVDSGMGHWGMETSQPFDPPMSDQRNGRLVLRSQGNTNCFGYWQSDQSWVPRHPDSLYVVSFAVASDQADPSRSPSLRMRLNSDSLRQSDIMRINSLGDAGLAPTLTGTSYRLYFEPMDLGQVDVEGRDGMNVSFDLLNFDRNDAPDGELTLLSLGIDAIPLGTVGDGTTLMEWTFENGAAGWTFGSAPAAFDAPEAAAMNGALTLHAPHQGNVFGYWSSPPDDVQGPWSGALLRATFHVAGNQADLSKVTQLRVRLNSADGQASVVKVVPSQDDGANSPSPAGTNYRIYFEVPPALVGQNLIASFDLMGFDPQDADDNMLSLDRVTIEQIPTPVVE